VQDTDTFVLGRAFLRAAYVVLDQRSGHHRVGIGALNTTACMDPVDEQRSLNSSTGGGNGGGGGGGSNDDDDDGMLARRISSLVVLSLTHAFYESLQMTMMMMMMMMMMTTVKSGAPNADLRNAPARDQKRRE